MSDSEDKVGSCLDRMNSHLDKMLNIVDKANEAKKNTEQAEITLNNQQSNKENDKQKCHCCDGYGFTAEHDIHPHINGDCNDMCPVQVQCCHCEGTGLINKEE